LSTVPVGGGYSAEIMLGDADIALAALTAGSGSITVVGRGLGAYIALLLAGARSKQVQGAVLCDGVGLTGGATGPTSGSFVQLAPRAEPPDPYALFELSRDLRPPDYATHFVNLALEGSGLDEPIAVCAITRPRWLAAVVEEVGVVTCTIDEALALYA
jgi:pimeloyl-ACP methyl ester carboxylesterase